MEAGGTQFAGVFEYQPLVSPRISSQQCHLAARHLVNFADPPLVILSEVEGSLTFLQNDLLPQTVGNNKKTFN